MSCARRPAPLTPLLLSRAWTAVCQESLSLLGCVIGFAEGRQLFPLTIPPTATTDHRTTDADRIAATIAVVDAGCTPDASCNNRIRHATALTRTSRAVGASVSVNDVVSLVLQALSTRANSNISNVSTVAACTLFTMPHRPCIAALCSFWRQRSSTS